MSSRTQFPTLDNVYLMKKSRLKLFFIFPLLWKPLKVSFAKKYELLSTHYAGDIFTTSGTRHRNLPISKFRFHSEIAGPSPLTKHIKRLFAEILLPLYLYWPRSTVDVVITYDPYASGLAGLILKFFFRAKLIVEVNGDYHKREPSKNTIKKWIMRLVFHLSLRASDAVKTLNRDQQDYFTKLLAGKRVYRFPDFVVSEYFQDLECYQGNYILSVGFPFDLKGMDILIRAFKLIAHKHEQMKLRIMGYCPEEELRKYKQIAQDDQRIEFIKPGWVEDVGEQMRGCYVLVNAARSEAMGRIHVEAMACRKPIIATRTNGGMECVDDGRTGFLCEIENIEDLARKLDCLLSNAELAAEMGRAGLERMQERFSEEKYVSSFVAMIEEVVRG